MRYSSVLFCSVQLVLVVVGTRLVPHITSCHYKYLSYSRQLQNGLCACMHVCVVCGTYMCVCVCVVCCGVCM